MLEPFRSDNSAMARPL